MDEISNKKVGCWTFDHQTHITKFTPFRISDGEKRMLTTSTTLYENLVVRKLNQVYSKSTRKWIPVVKTALKPLCT